MSRIWGGIALVIVLLVLCIIGSIEGENKCEWTKRENSPEVYFVNMDKSKSRRATIEQHMEQVGLKSFRVRGITPTEIYVPADIEATWRTAFCKLQTDWVTPNKLLADYDHLTSTWNKYSAYMASLCGRGKNKNSPKELGCTSSHLIAMHQAVYSTTAKSRYALVVEDDVYFPFDIDFDALAKSAPPDFGILQLFNSNEGSMDSYWRQYMKNSKNIWITRQVNTFDFWSTCAYLIDRVKMKEVIDSVIRWQNGWYELRIVAGISNPCVPSECCVNGSAYDNFIQKPPCIWAPRGYQADSYLYAMTKTYGMSIPIISNGQGGNQSTFHQDHVELFHKRAFRKQREIINELLAGKVKYPSYMKPACSELLDVNLL
jgi:GR25 family glycosyltransferase involved in LPS biosynthesis